MPRLVATLCVLVVFAGTLASRDLNGDLLKAAKAGKIEDVTTLLAKGASPNARDDKGQSALAIAVAAKAYSVANILLDAGATAADARPPLADFVLVWALTKNKTDLVDAMKAAGASAKNNFGRNAVSEAVRKKTPDSLDVLERLLTNDAPIDLALVDAAAAGATDAAKILLSHGADLDAQSGASVIVRFDAAQVAAGVPGEWYSLLAFKPGIGRDALMEAVVGKHAALVELLLEKGAKPDRSMVVHSARQVNDMPVEEVRIQFAIFVAAAVVGRSGNTTYTRQTTKTSAKLLHPTKEVRATPYCMAMSLNLPEIAARLTARGASPVCIDEALANTRIDQGGVAFGAKDYAGAATLFRQALEANPTSAVAQGDLGMSLTLLAYLASGEERLSRMIEAQTHLQSAVKGLPQQAIFQVYLRMATGVLDLLRAEQAGTVARMVMFRGGAGNKSIFVNDVELARLADGRFLVVKLAPGTYQIGSDQRGLPTMTLEAEAGKTYYVRSHTAIIAGEQLEIVDEATARGPLAKAKPIDAQFVLDPIRVVR